MAKSRKIASKTSKPAKADKRPTGEVEVVEEKKGMGWEGAVGIVTTIILIAAILCADKDLAAKFNHGTFF